MDWYEPGEDTYTLIDAIEAEALRGMVVLDLGTSTGVITQLLKKQNTVISSDMNIKALLNHSGGNLVRADLLSCINQNAFDAVAFNPPYVLDSDDPVIGGEAFGRSVIDRFIDTVRIPTVYLLVIKANKPQEIISSMEARGYQSKVIKIRKIMGETIYIIKGILNSSQVHAQKLLNSTVLLN
ncbi:putative HemK-like methylase [Ordospora colligata]|uniref:Putative HemK-like methylase n=1 Tax=Ordospora colligata OC4 TaxID=1354746 RepID=A0A0B2UJM2_9MICR|nr:putative HemK-like methylase [Ordospora colligata OC4]KHN69563.1 putative HemK-like methylase [Ordospora colligata OC4]TBU15383.1 putative HemK-like methylase [Ordospora colligata]TBU15483.1 putative HemK-like methylase [Ordospora colligata]TBU18579.1 putative HemK-like methylase [Ordospora colligata]